MGREYKARLTFHEYRFRDENLEKMGLSTVRPAIRVQDGASVLFLIRFQGTDLEFPLPQRQISDLEEWKPLNSPYLLTFQDWGVMEEEGLICFVLEPFYGEVLSHALADGKKWTPAEAAHLFSGLLPALEVLRMGDLFHGQLNPENLLLVDGQLAAWGFGLRHNDLRYARLNHEGWILEDILRWTLPYSSPEAILGKPVARGDQYSLGTVLYHMLTGSAPYPVDLESILKEANGGGTRQLPPFPSDMPPEVVVALTQMLTGQDESEAILAALRSGQPAAASEAPEQSDRVEYESPLENLISNLMVFSGCLGACALGLLGVSLAFWILGWMYKEDASGWTRPVPKIALFALGAMAVSVFFGWIRSQIDICYWLDHKRSQVLLRRKVFFYRGDTRVASFKDLHCLAVAGKFVNESQGKGKPTKDYWLTALWLVTKKGWKIRISDYKQEGTWTPEHSHLPRTLGLKLVTGPSARQALKVRWGPKGPELIWKSDSWTWLVGLVWGLVLTLAAGLTCGLLSDWLK